MKKEEEKPNRPTSGGLRLQPGYYYDPHEEESDNNDGQAGATATGAGNKLVAGGDDDNETAKEKEGLRLQPGYHRGNDEEVALVDTASGNNNKMRRMTKKKKTRFQRGNKQDTTSTKTQQLSEKKRNVTVTSGGVGVGVGDIVTSKTKKRREEHLAQRQERLVVVSPRSSASKTDSRREKHAKQRQTRLSDGRGRSSSSGNSNHDDDEDGAGWDDDDESMLPGAIAYSGMNGGHGHGDENTIIVGDGYGDDNDGNFEHETNMGQGNVTEVHNDIDDEIIKNATLVNEKEIEEEIVNRKAQEIRDRAMIHSVKAEQVTFWERHRISLIVSIVGIVVVVVVVSIFTLLLNKGGTLTGKPYLIQLLSPISGRDVLTNETTYQYMALDWLAFDDTYDYIADMSSSSSSSSITKDLVLIERYVVALLWFTMGGMDWNSNYNFLSNTSVCEWKSSSTQSNNFTNATFYDDDNYDDDAYYDDDGAFPVAYDDDDDAFVADDESGGGGIRVNGVHCNSDGFVNQIRLEANNVTGTIPSELSHLSNMEFFVLSRNAGISGTIPSSIGDLALLKELLLDRCPLLTGTIPETFTKLQSLEFLSIWNNNLTGTLPSQLFTSLPSLEVVQLGLNSLSGLLPEFLKRGPMKRIKIADNYLEGTLPESIYELSSLEELTLDGNYLNGTITSSRIANLKNNLETLGLASNYLSGTLPTQLGELGRLTTLDVSYNQLSGTIPTELGRLFRSEPIADDGLIVNGLWLNDNLLSGTIPTELGLMYELGGIDLANNQLRGVVPSELGRLSLLRENYIGLDHNNITGSLDDIFCNNQPFNPSILKADCDKVQCKCCTDCCYSPQNIDTAMIMSNNFFYNESDSSSDGGQCFVNVPLICENIGYQTMNHLNPPEWGTICECSSTSNTHAAVSNEKNAASTVMDDNNSDGGGGRDGGSEAATTDEFVYLSCADKGCVSCDTKGKACIENIDYGYDLPIDTGFDNLYHCTMKYVQNNDGGGGGGGGDQPRRQHETVTYRIDLWTFECEVYIDDIKCNSCLEDRRCSDGFTGIRVDCSNVHADAIYDDCDPSLTGGALLQFFKSEYFEQDCYPCIY